MNKGTIDMVELLERVVYRKAELLSITNEPTADWLEVVRPHSGSPLSPNEEVKVSDYLKAITDSGFHVALLSDGASFDGQPPTRLLGRQFRLFYVARLGDEMILRQAGRLRSSVSLSRMQIRGMLPNDLTPAGPCRGYMDLLVPAPFV